MTSLHRYHGCRDSDRSRSGPAASRRRSRPQRRRETPAPQASSQGAAEGAPCLESTVPHALPDPRGEKQCRGGPADPCRSSRHLLHQLPSRFGRVCLTRRRRGGLSTTSLRRYHGCRDGDHPHSPLREDADRNDEAPPHAAATPSYDAASKGEKHASSQSRSPTRLLPRASLYNMSKGLRGIRLRKAMASCKE